PTVSAPASHRVHHPSPTRRSSDLAAKAMAAPFDTLHFSDSLANLEFGNPAIAAFKSSFICAYTSVLLALTATSYASLKLDNGFNNSGTSPNNLTKSK